MAASIDDHRMSMSFVHDSMISSSVPVSVSSELETLTVTLLEIMESWLSVWTELTRRFAFHFNLLFWISVSILRRSRTRRCM